MRRQLLALVLVVSGWLGAVEKMTVAQESNLVIGPEYRIDPDLTDKGNPKGKRFEFSMKLADSKIFRVPMRRWTRARR